MKKILLLMIISLSFVACASTSPKPKPIHLNVIPETQGGVLGWSQTKETMTFNTGGIHYDFDNSPVGKIFNSFFKEKEKEKEIKELPPSEDVPLVEVEETEC